MSSVLSLTRVFLISVAFLLPSLLWVVLGSGSVSGREKVRLSQVPISQNREPRSCDFRSPPPLLQKVKKTNGEAPSWSDGSPLTRDPGFMGLLWDVHLISG